MKNFLYISFLIFSSLASCQNKTENKIKKAENQNSNIKCEIYYEKYIEKMSIRDKDSAIYFIDKSIVCDQLNNDYKYAKVQFYISDRKYKEALSNLNEIKFDSIDNSLELFKIVLKLKLDYPESEKDLKYRYDKFLNIEKPSSDDFFYKIALDNMFKGKEFALTEIKKYKILYKESYQIQNIDALEKLIISKNKEDVLFSLFNIR